MKKRFKKTVFLLTMFLFLLGAAAAVSAKTSYKNQWVTTSAGKTYYYGSNGKKLKGMQQIGTKYYYFDANGIQRTGWVKIGKNYNFFKIASQKKGYRVSSKTVNGIKLQKSGKAKLTSYSKRKLAILVKASKTVWTFTNDNMTKKQKLKKAFEYTKSHLRAYNMGSFRKGSNWDLTYAEIVFSSKRADCYGYGVYFAYLANAVGYKASAVSSGGHGWAEIGGKIYDANWALVDKRYSYFGLSSSLSGKNNIPNYAKNRVYVKTI